MGYYDVAQLCLNGHTITLNALRSPQLQKKYCDKCGEPTTMQCSRCNSPIHGEYHVDGVFVVSSSSAPPPNFCHECGNPYPWTERRIFAAKSLADEFEQISDDERQILKQTLDDLYRDSPNTEVAAVRFKKVMAKVGKESFASMKSILVDVLSEAAKRGIFGG